jgi:hypothetical protein
LGGASTRLAVGIAERIWTIGKGNHVWTGYGNNPNWRKTSITAEDIWVVNQDPEFSAGKGSVSDVFTIEDGTFCWRIWDNAIAVDVTKPEPARWEKFIGTPPAHLRPFPASPAPIPMAALGGKKYQPPSSGSIRFQNVVAIGNGTVYLLVSGSDGGNELALWKKSNARHFDTANGPRRPSGSHPHKGIAINRENIYLFTKDKIYFCGREALVANHGYNQPWKTIDGPASNSSFVMPKDWSYEQLFASDDGSLLATINKEIYLWDGEEWRKNNHEGDKAVGLFRVPVRGWEIFGAVKDLVEKVKIGV